MPMPMPMKLEISLAVVQPTKDLLSLFYFIMNTKKKGVPQNKK